MNNDRAFRQEAATTGLQDWSGMKADLYNYHTAGADTSYIPTATHSFRTRGREPVSSARHGKPAAPGTVVTAPARVQSASTNTYVTATVALDHIAASAAHASSPIAPQNAIDLDRPSAHAIPSGMGHQNISREKAQTSPERTSSCTVTPTSLFELFVPS